MLTIISTTITISISSNLNKINIIVNYVLKYSSRLQKEYLFRASLNLFLSPDKSLMAVGR